MQEIIAQKINEAIGNEKSFRKLNTYRQLKRIWKNVPKLKPIVDFGYIGVMKYFDKETNSPKTSFLYQDGVWRDDDVDLLLKTASQDRMKIYIDDERMKRGWFGKRDSNNNLDKYEGIGYTYLVICYDLDEVKTILSEEEYLAFEEYSKLFKFYLEEVSDEDINE